MPGDNPAPPRRSFFFALVALLGALAGLLAGWPVVGYFFGRKRRAVDWVTLGPINRFAIGETELATVDTPLWLPWDGDCPSRSLTSCREEPGDDGAARFLVLANYCTHAGCPVTWLAESDLFACPCHGGTFHADGSLASGPPRRGLYHCAWRPPTRSWKSEAACPHVKRRPDHPSRTRLTDLDHSKMSENRNRGEPLSRCKRCWWC